MEQKYVEPWRSQSAVTGIGAWGPMIDALPADLRALRQASTQMVNHYLVGPVPVPKERMPEIDTRCADAMLERLVALGPENLVEARPPEARIAGCCRDFSVLFVAMARHKGLAARIRVGYGAYFNPGWYLDHVIAEIWDEGEERWRLIEPELSDEYAARVGFDPLDVPREQFLIGPNAWRLARTGKIDPERCVVAPDFEEPYTRSWLSLRHHLVQDLAALRKAEMVLWDQWGILNESDPLSRAAEFDRLAGAMLDPACSPERLAAWWQMDGYAVPERVTSYSPASPTPLQVDVRWVLTGTI